MPRHRAPSAASRMTDEKAEVSTAQVATEARLAQPQARPSWGRQRKTIHGIPTARLARLPDRQLSSDHGPRIAPESERTRTRVSVDRESRLLVTEDLLLRKCPGALRTAGRVRSGAACPSAHATAQRSFCEDNGVGGSILHATPFLGVVKQESEIARLPLASTWTCRVIDQFEHRLRRHRHPVSRCPDR